jgi:hypothetical protein
MLQQCGAVTHVAGAPQARIAEVMLLCNRRCYVALQQWWTPLPKCFLKNLYSLVATRGRVFTRERKRKKEKRGGALKPIKDLASIS